MFSFKELGITFVYFSEPNHGSMEAQNLPALPGRFPILSVNVDNNISSTSDAETPDTAVPDLFFGANRFLAKQIVIALGYYALIASEQRDVVELFLARTSTKDTKVAQIMADEPLRFANLGKRMKRTSNGVMLLPGIHNLTTKHDMDVSFYFLAKFPF